MPEWENAEVISDRDGLDAVGPPCKLEMPLEVRAKRFKTVFIRNLYTQDLFPRDGSGFSRVVTKRILCTVTESPIPAVAFLVRMPVLLRRTTTDTLL